MGVLSHQQIQALVEGPEPLISEYVDLEHQLQPNGFDLTLRSIARFHDSGRLERDDGARRLAAPDDLSFDAQGMVRLAPAPYLITLNEVVRLPSTIMALGRPRSSLLRSGAAIHNAVWDAGYHGRSQALLVVYNPHGFSVARDARILQLVFLALEAPTVAPYTGVFQNIS